MRQPTQGPVLKERVWCFLEALLTRAEGSHGFEIHWETDKSTGSPNLVVKTKRRFLESLTQLKPHEIYEVIESLEKLEIWDDRRLKQGKGSEIGFFALKLWSIDAPRNREQFERAWEGSRTAKSKALEATYNRSKDSAEASQSEIDWHNICLAMLENQKRLTTNLLLSADEDMRFELDDIHVPLALVQRTKPDKRSGDVSPEEGSQLLQPTYEEKQRFRHDEFLAQVLQEGKGQSQGRRIAVIGEPGAGKTTLLQSIAFWLLKDQNQNLGLPIWISLADLQGKTLEEYLLQRWLKNALEVVRVTPEQENALLELFKNNRVWLLLDGVDEIAAASRELPLQIVESQLKGWVAKARVVLTCRLNVWEADLNALGDDFEKYRLLDFDYPLQVKEFICRWFRKTDADKGERLWAELDKSERQRIQDLVKNPLRLALLCSTWQSSDKGLPSTKAALYQRFVEVFYTWKANRFPTNEDQQKELNAALGSLAKRAIDQEASRFRLKHKLLREELGDPKQPGSLFGLALQLGWLNKVGLAAESETEEKVYAFYHPTFQEYFAALAIDDWHFFLNHFPLNPGKGTYRIFEPQWKEVILLWLGLAEEKVAKKQKEKFIEALIEFEDGCSNYYKFRAYFIAAAGIAEFGCCTKADEIVAQVAGWAFGNFKVEKYKWQTLSNPIPEEARVALRETERGRAIAELVKRQSLKLLGEIGIGNSQAIKNLEKIIELPDNKFSRIQIETTEALLKIHPNNAIGLKNLLELITQTEYGFIRKEAIEVLGRVGTGQQEFISVLEQIVFQPNDYLDLLVQAANSLGKIDPSNPKFVPALVKFMEPNEDEINLRQICENFRKSGSDDYFISLFLQLNQPIRYEDARSQAFKRLEKIAPYNSDVIPALLQVINSTKQEYIQWENINVLGKIGRDNTEAITTLEKFIKPPNPENLCRIAAESLGKIYPNHPGAIAELVRLTKSAKGENIYWLAARSLGEIGKGNSKAIAALEQLIKSTETGLTHRLIAEALWKIDPDNPTIIQTLEKLIEPDKDERTRRLTAESLGRIYPNHPEAVAELVKIIKSTEDESILRGVAYSLNKILRQEDRMIEVVAALKEYLLDETRKNNRHRYRECYKIIWHCAKNMTYPAFHRAWHPQEGVEKTTTSNNQSLNQTDLPQSLQSAIANDPQLSQIIHLICIDGSQFIDHDRPAAKIYAEMVKRGCSKCDDGTPKMMAELQVYWDLLETEGDKCVVLVFYASSTHTTSANSTAMSCPYSETFLSDLSKFGDRICVVTNQAFDHIRLKFFTPSHAITDVTEWIRAIAAT